MVVRAVTRGVAVDEIVERIVPVRGPGGWARVLVDGAAQAGPGEWADALVDPLRIAGRPTLRVCAEDFLRPASLRLEYGRHDPDAYYTDRLDAGALRREVLDPLGAGGSGLVLPRLWDAATDRSPRAERVPLAAGGVLLLDGSLLLGLDLLAELRIHLHLSEPALARRMPDDLAWTLPAHRRYAAEVDPQRRADVTLLLDHPTRPALLTPQ